MIPSALTVASRRRLLGSVALLGVGARGANEVRHCDQSLIAAALAFCNTERRMLSLIEGPDRVAADDARGLLLAPLRDEQAPHLDLVCRERAWSLAGHQARAIAFALWDGGEITERAATQGFLADRLLAALVRDLADVPC